MVGVKSSKIETTLILAIKETTICDFCHKIIPPRGAYILFERVENGTYTKRKRSSSFSKKCCTNCFEKEYPNIIQENESAKQPRLDLDLG